MNLRARLAAWLAVLAGAAAIAVAVTSYQATASRLGAEVDSTLASYGRRLAGPDASLARALCARAEGIGDRFRRPRANPLLDLPGATIQCLGPDGTVIASAEGAGLPVSDVDRRAAGGQLDQAVLRTADLGELGGVRMITVPVNGGAVQLARSTEENDRVLGALRTRAALLAVGTSVVAAVAGWAIARSTTKPVLALTELTERIASEGRLDLDVPTSGRDEVGRLARSFSGMLDALRRSRSQQQRLVQDAGHELRTPLTSLRTNVDTLRRHPDLVGRRRDDLLDDLDAELRELTDLTNELVGLAADAGVEEPMEQVDLAAIASRSAARLQRRTGREVVVTAAPFPLVGQPRQLARLVDNLLDNAAKFSPGPTPIELTVQPGMVAVRDHGPGFGEADLPHVFERFYRATGARSTPGSGLGLSIVADVAGRHGATATAMDLPDGGAGVVVRFPASN